MQEIASAQVNPQYAAWVDELSKTQFFAEDFHCPDCDTSRLVCPECYRQGVSGICSCTYLRIEKAWVIGGKR